MLEIPGKILYGEIFIIKLRKSSIFVYSIIYLLQLGVFIMERQNC